MKSIHKIVQSHTNAQERKLLQMTGGLPSFTGKDDATFCLFVFHSEHSYLKIAGTNVSSNSMQRLNIV